MTLFPLRGGIYIFTFWTWADIVTALTNNTIEVSVGQFPGQTDQKLLISLPWSLLRLNVSSPNLYVKALIPNVMLFMIGTFPR